MCREYSYQNVSWPVDGPSSVAAKYRVNCVRNSTLITCTTLNMRNCFSNAFLLKLGNPSKRIVTEDNLEQTMATNHFGRMNKILIFENFVNSPVDITIII